MMQYSRKNLYVLILWFFCEITGKTSKNIISGKAYEVHIKINNIFILYALAHIKSQGLDQKHCPDYQPGFSPAMPELGF